MARTLPKRLGKALIHLKRGSRPGANFRLSGSVAALRHTGALFRSEMTMHAAHTAIRIEPFKVACSSCNLREICLPLGISSQQLERLDEMVSNRRGVARGEALFRAGDAFTSTFATFIALGSKPEHALHAATVNAASVVSYVDTQTGLLPRAEVEKRAAARASEMPVQRWELDRDTPVARRSIRAAKP